MFLQWGFTEKGIELICSAPSVKGLDMDRDDVETVYIDKEPEVV